VFATETFYLRESQPGVTDTSAMRKQTSIIFVLDFQAVIFWSVVLFSKLAALTFLGAEAISGRKYFQQVNI